ncbi:hypothetical protein F3Y22_tig00111792pilonHSYRG00081 [Hibiscus syriacus]|uniref:Pentatricopeptide repeat-containing protein n=1 Tax=Hibiscus syriacus TaxID=106335 RepID=A0A6A2XDK0_HIBSY|nr:hypothetical protein F3Y22_tig00111792pilonHSYRG00081 [Hibiscus syriacus]
MLNVDFLADFIIQTGSIKPLCIPESVLWEAPTKASKLSLKTGSNMGTTCHINLQLQEKNEIMRLLFRLLLVAPHCCLKWSDRQVPLSFAENGGAGFCLECSYNDIMRLYTNTERHEKVPDVMREMKEKNVSPDNFSYRICINSFGVMSNLEAMEEILTEMENQPHIKMDPWIHACFSIC